MQGDQVGFQDNDSFNIGNLTTKHSAVNLGGTVQGDQIGSQINHPIDPEIKRAIAELQTLLTQLQTQHPHVTTETEALAIIDAEFTETQPFKMHRLATLHQQILNPERHLQAIKATLGEVAKHYLEESVWAKASITYFDKLSEAPDRGI
ncbi:MAG: hypothetical protein KME16_04165 [Scytolyngbya sp. HA4215-MV1]|nr:hypothetical protein [Scytolyngbya sp. HA4215-MV1]